ncbi:MAG TPA: stage V sporulation protein AD [Candidatus Fimivicinus intestinavium]|nr:stage V sporulation protein AD [Candidatus Fimivicinus intestinavium]
MAMRAGRYTITLPSRPIVLGFGAVGGKKEGEGPLAAEFDHIFEDSTLGEASWEKAESKLHREAVLHALSKAQKSPADIDVIFAGDLLSQCIGTCFGIRELDMPFAGLYGACSTMALSLLMAAVFIDTGTARLAVASTSSHFCSAEKQFRFPLEYGGQRPPSAQWTATAAGAAVLGASGEGPRVESVIIGKMQDLGIKDANNMGAAMAPAASATIAAFLHDTCTTPEEYDMILTGDLGAIGSKLLIELLRKDYQIDIASVHADCGLMLYDLDRQDVNSGASGCGCSGSVVCSYVMSRLKQGELRRVLFVGTGALMSAVSSKQGETIPGIAHGVLLTNG